MVTNYCKECARLARVNEENIKLATAAQEQDAKEIERLREAIGQIAEQTAEAWLGAGEVLDCTCKVCVEVREKMESAILKAREIAREER